MDLWCPFAKKRPLGTQTEPRIGTPRIMILHTMSGYLAGTDSYFRTGGYDGTESHFGVGGNWDKGRDGEIWQWQSLDHSADAQFGGNAYATSVETSDGAHDNVPWSDKQLAAIIKLGHWWCVQTGNPARLVKAPSEHGFGYHALFHEWNKNDHNCPGAPRVRQLKTEVIPEIAHLLGGPAPKPPVPPAVVPQWPGRILEVADPMMHGPDVLAWQKQLQARGWSLTADGFFGPKTGDATKAFQVDKHLLADSRVGPITWRAGFTLPT